MWEWENDRVGEWESERMTEWENERVGEWESKRVRGEELREWGSERNKIVSQFFAKAHQLISSVLFSLIISPEYFYNSAKLIIDVVKKFLINNNNQILFELRAKHKYILHTIE